MGDREAIEKAVQLYVDGARTGDVGKLKEAFHEDARMFGHLGGQRYDETIGEMITMLAGQPAGPAYQAKITDVTVTGDVGIAELHEEGFWGTLSFVDIFSLAKIDGTWKIVNKIFQHTGGELPTE